LFLWREEARAAALHVVTERYGKTLRAFNSPPRTPDPPAPDGPDNCASKLITLKRRVAQLEDELARRGRQREGEEAEFGALEGQMRVLRAGVKRVVSRLCQLLLVLDQRPGREAAAEEKVDDDVDGCLFLVRRVEENMKWWTARVTEALASAEAEHVSRERILLECLRGGVAVALRAERADVGDVRKALQEWSRNLPEELQPRPSER
jgi:hypothetical protein